MARRQVIEIQCDRCNKVETVPTDRDKDVVGPSLVVKFGGREVKYDDLCGKCHSAVGGYFSQMVREATKKEPVEEKKKPNPLTGIIGKRAS